MASRLEVDAAADAGVQRDLKGTREAESARAPRYNIGAAVIAARLNMLRLAAGRRAS